MVDLDSISVGDDKSRIHWLSPYPVDMHSNITVISKRWVCCTNCGYESNQRTARKLGLLSGTQACVVDSADNMQHQQSGLLQERVDSADNMQHQQSGLLQERVDSADKKQHQQSGLQQGEIRFHTWRQQVVISVNAPADFQCTLDYLPSSEFMVASCNGLLLLLRSDGFPCQNLCQHQYYICNPLNKQWASLPPAPCIYGLKNSELVYFGFMFNLCANCFDTGNHDQMMSCTNCSFKVVQFPQFPQCDQSRSEFQVHIYSSESGKWTSATVQSPKSFRWGLASSSSAIVHNGCLYWRTRDSIDIQEDHEVEFVVYDPYKNKIHGILNGPPRSQMCQTHTHGKGHLFVCRGSLWLSQYSALSGFLRIWELKNSVDAPVDASGNLKLDDFCWSPYRLCHFSEMNGGFNWFTEGSHVDNVVAFHPFDPDIVYMQLKIGSKHGYFTECNLRNKTMQKVELEHHCHRLAKDIHTLYLLLRFATHHQGYIDC